MNLAETKELSSRGLRTLGYSVVAVIVLALAIMISSALFLPLDGFVVEVSNRENFQLREVRFSKLGKDGEVGLLRPGETKRIVVKKDSFKKTSTLQWRGPSGRWISSGGLSESYGELEGEIQLFRFEAGSVTRESRPLKLWEKLESRR